MLLRRRCLPFASRTHFKEVVITHRIRYGEDSATSCREIRSYYYDEVQRWVALPRDSVSVVGGMVCSKTTYFTDIINAIVKVPEMPETKESPPLLSKNCKPFSSGIQMIQHLRQQSTANVSYPIQVPVSSRLAAEFVD